MLKIKDDLDLKELEKLGLEPRYDEYTGEVTKYIADGLEKGLEVQIKNNRRIELCMLYEYLDADFDTLYDLIQAGLVEKVEEKQ